MNNAISTQRNLLSGRSRLPSLAIGPRALSRIQWKWQHQYGSRKRQPGEVTRHARRTARWRAPTEPSGSWLDGRAYLPGRCSAHDTPTEWDPWSPPATIAPSGRCALDPPESRHIRFLTLLLLSFGCLDPVLAHRRPAFWAHVQQCQRRSGPRRTPSLQRSLLQMVV